MSAPRVLIIGCGVAGPVLAVLLKQKGYDPIMFEKVRQLGDVGASLMLMPNGIKVLQLVGLADAVKAESAPLQGFWEGKATGEMLAESDLPSTFLAKYGQPAAGVKRTSLNMMLKDMLLDLGVEVREGWKLATVSETDEDVTALFENGQSVKGSFLIGGDGIKASSRAAMLNLQGVPQSAPNYTGLVQVAGISETPEEFLEKAIKRNWYGQGAHVIAYPISPTLTSWAITMPEDQEAEETWHLYTPGSIKTEAGNLVTMLDGWDPTLHRMITSAQRVIKYGLFDRAHLQPHQWYTERCVLVGDAAHPTSPHLGQGANQALEDCYHLSIAMPVIDPKSDDYGRALETLGKYLSKNIFAPFAEKRQPRTSALVKGARIQGELRVSRDPQRCQERDALIRDSFKDSAAVEAQYDSLLREPFQQTSS
ncbi:hypothetical protein B0T25DRAFT_102228 [Lasiosphaeria hispida]|uniref:FAD-binding domain-containing protein n=1 Tax=Lasiosphaeria hispida TaxID=260671 RepID=A0AAJ0MHS5_9PEZI|nr:hypothetical protein B0T25DRAFT_102228 [Lasiosphaeria hispida]